MINLSNIVKFHKEPQSFDVSGIVSFPQEGHTEEDCYERIKQQILDLDIVHEKMEYLMSNIVNEQNDYTTLKNKVLNIENLGDLINLVQELSIKEEK